MYYPYFRIGRNLDLQERETESMSDRQTENERENEIVGEVGREGE